MKLWALPDEESPERVVNLDAFLGLEIQEHRQGSVHRWRLVGILSGSYILLYEHSDRTLVVEKFQEGTDVLTGHRAPLGVGWRGPGDDPPGDDPRLGLPLRRGA